MCSICSPCAPTRRLFMTCVSGVPSRRPSTGKGLWRPSGIVAPWPRQSPEVWPSGLPIDQKRENRCRILPHRESGSVRITPS